jgi:dTDP-4-amino-4,6-dideoxygalactose transaminase
MSELNYGGLISIEDLDEIRRLVLSGNVCGWWGKQSGGEYLHRFENRMSTVTGLRHVKAVSSGTASIYLALRALGVQRGDAVITTAYNHIGGLAPIIHNDSIPYFVDVDEYGNMNYLSFLKALEEPHRSNSLAESLGLKSPASRPKVVVITHELGTPCRDTKMIVKKAHDHDMTVIEDCSQALGAKIDFDPVGSFGDVACFSTGGDMTKMITTGEGGVVASNIGYIADAVDNLRNHGDKKGAIYPCFNFRMSDLNALIGLITLKKLDEQLTRTKVNADYLITSLKEAWVYHDPPKNVTSSNYIIPFTPNGYSDPLSAVPRVEEKLGPSKPRRAVSRGYQTVLTDLPTCRDYPRGNLINTYAMKDTSLWVDWHRWPHTRGTMKDVIDILTDVF